MPHDPRRIIIVGPPGAGKTTLARKLGAHYGLPVHHLDSFHFGETPATPDYGRARARIRAAMADPAWILDGMTLPEFASGGDEADLIVSYHISPLLRYYRCLRRTIGNYGRTRPEMGPAYRDHLERRLYLDIIPYWDRREQTQIDATLRRLVGRKPVIDLRSMRAIDRFYADPLPAITAALAIDPARANP